MKMRSLLNYAPRHEEILESECVTPCYEHKNLKNNKHNMNDTKVTGLEQIMHSFAAQSKTTQRHWLRANDS
jgi:hypothetical protein